MFDFLRKSRNPQRPSAAIADALAVDGLPSGMEAWGLAMVARRGSYAGRPVRYFRVFDPSRVAEQGVSVRVFTDLDAHPSLVLGSGHVERDGGVVVTRRSRPPTPGTPERSQVDRAAHTDDERYVFPGTS